MLSCAQGIKFTRSEDWKGHRTPMKQQFVYRDGSSPTPEFSRTHTSPLSLTASIKHPQTPFVSFAPVTTSAANTSFDPNSQLVPEEPQISDAIRAENYTDAESKASPQGLSRQTSTSQVPGIREKHNWDFSERSREVLPTPVL
jgi:hypothetical protein